MQFKIFYNLLTVPRTVSIMYAQVARAQSCANHLQHTECLSCATCCVACHVVPRDSSADVSFSDNSTGSDDYNSCCCSAPDLECMVSCDICVSVYGGNSPEQRGVWRSVRQHHRSAGQEGFPPQQCVSAEGQLHLTVLVLADRISLLLILLLSTLVLYRMSCAECCGDMFLYRMSCAECCGDMFL